MKKRTKKYGTAIFGTTYTAPDGVVMTWSPIHKRYVPAPDGDVVPAVPKVIGVETIYLGQEKCHGGRGAKVVITAILKSLANIDPAMIPDADPDCDRYHVGDDIRLRDLGGVKGNDLAEVHHWDARAGRWGIVADAVAVEDLAAFQGVPRGESAPSSPSAAAECDKDGRQGRPDAPRGDDTAKAVADIGQAMGLLLAAMGALRADPADLPLPDVAFDDALKADVHHQANRKAFVRAFQRVFVAMPVSARTRLMRLEESVNALVVSGSAVAWRMGLTMKGAARGKTK